MDEILARAGIFQGVDPSAVSALTKQLQPVDFPRGHTVFNEGEPGDRVSVRGEMDDAVGLEFGKGAGNGAKVPDIGPVEVMARVVPDGGDIRQAAGIGQGVQGQDMRIRLPDQLSHHRGTDEAGAAGNDYSHA